MVINHVKYLLRTNQRYEIFGFLKLWLRQNGRQWTITTKLQKKYYMPQWETATTMMTNRKTVVVYLVFLKKKQTKNHITMIMDFIYYMMRKAAKIKCKWKKKLKRKIRRANRNNQVEYTSHSNSEHMNSSEKKTTKINSNTFLSSVWQLLATSTIYSTNKQSHTSTVA